MVDLTRRNFLFALVASVVAAGAPLPVGFPRDQWARSIVASQTEAQASLSALIASNNHMLEQFLRAGIIIRGETKALVPV